MANQEVKGFMENLAAFYDTLPEDQKPMLEAILETARDGADTSGFIMPNAYTAEMMARGQMDDRLREAEHARRVSLAEDNGGADSPGGPGLFDWLGGWLSAVRAAGHMPGHSGPVS
jgi:hypothetical protein